MPCLASARADNVMLRPVTYPTGGIVAVSKPLRLAR
jgi:hypothetical protein